MLSCLTRTIVGRAPQLEPKIGKLFSGEEKPATLAKKALVNGVVDYRIAAFGTKLIQSVITLELRSRPMQIYQY